MNFVKIGSAGTPVLPYLHVIRHLLSFGGMPSEKRSRTQKKEDFTESEMAWNRMVLRMILSCVHTIHATLLSHLGVRAGRELYQTKELVDQRLERRALEMTGPDQWDAKRSWSRQISMDESMEEPGENDFILVENQAIVQNLTENNRATIRCFCGQPTVVLQRGRNRGRLFRCNFFTWLEHQPFWMPSSAASSDEVPPPIDYPKAPTTPAMSELSTSGFTTPNENCSHRNVTYAGSNAFLRQAKCRDCGKVLKKEKVNPEPSPYSPSLGDTKPRGPPPPQPVNQPPSQSMKVKGGPKPSSSAPGPNQKDQDDWDEYQEFRR